ncbi:MAG: hypothetical protein QY312_03220 [Candidatus Dojkabacteria bacterium]|nr:MAG: hypothetical protein QY312_03220 [Candidatus Dojkabacteria bacterium]
MNEFLDSHIPLWKYKKKDYFFEKYLLRIGNAEKLFCGGVLVQVRQGRNETVYRNLYTVFLTEYGEI